MTLRTIVPSEGLVNSRDALLTQEGTLSRADDAEYLPDNPAPYKVLGRAAFNAAPEGSSIVGVVYTSTPNGGSEILVHDGTVIRKATSAATGTFADLFTGLTGGTILSAAHLDRHVILANGVDRMRIYGEDFPTGGTLGYNENTIGPSLSRDGGAATGFILASGKKIRYWIEERMKDASGNILKRSAPVAPPSGATSGNGVTELVGDGSTDKPRLTRPTLASETTDWALFATATEGVFPNGALIAEAPAATTFIDDPRTGTNPTLPTGTLFEKVSVTALGVAELVSRNGQPPIASTLTVFDNQIVADDVTDAEVIRWCFPGRPHAWPALFVARPGAGDIRGRVQGVYRVGEVLIITLDTRLTRMLTLPQEIDDAFSPERIVKDIEGAFGCVGKRAADVFLYRNRPILAYASPEGIFGTDGDVFINLARDIDYKNLVELTQSSQFIVQNNPARFQLIFAYVPLGGTSVTKALILHYHEEHIKDDGRLTVTGPVPWSAVCTTRALVAGQFRVFSGRSNGVLYLENEGNTRPAADGGFNFVLELAERRFASLGRKGSLGKVLIHHSAAAPGQNLAATLISTDHGFGPTDHHLGAVDLSLREAAEFLTNSTADSHSIRVENSDSLGTFGINAFAFEVRDGGET